MTNLEKSNCIQAANEWIAQKLRPDGLFATSDLAAAFCMQTFKSAGLKVPADIAVAGFNNDVISTLVEPNLTTVNYSGYNIGETAARMLIGHLTGASDISFTSTIVLSSTLLVRESSLRQEV